jgi:hypothetical protein
MKAADIFITLATIFQMCLVRWTTIQCKYEDIISIRITGKMAQKTVKGH